jgi:hypothetical protein
MHEPFQSYPIFHGLDYIPAVILLCSMLSRLHGKLNEVYT